MPHTRKAQQKHRPPLSTADPAAVRQRIVAVGVVQHPTTGHYQVWLHARGQTAMLLAYRTLEQADAAKHALGEALVRGEYATPERWVAAVAAIGAETDVPVEPVSDEVFAAINATIQGGELRAPDVPMHAAGASADDSAEPPDRDDSPASVPTEQR
jgi:hypothetical protein